ncbi:MAG TPA: D-alanyl-D-alanine carboxypeptidase/D-alanyl-D-alanine-endopeptidase, partial [Candidatus Marinimicrobia bacterium]|nr:D-alanyl-D-alanine carboxypeptidase/D-alanyl-D-alanine-endopeptidase [Candidatus Neomarinimicrobiota bacterium]
EHFIQLLSWAYNTNQIWGNLISILPGGGVGTLKNRMNGKNGNRIIAKTGSLSGVSCLSGYVFTKSGEPLVFSILMNGFIGKTKPYSNLQDKITTILSEL